MSSTSDKISGKSKQVVGKVTDNKELQAKGKVQEAAGKAEGAVKKAGEKLNDKI